MSILYKKSIVNLFDKKTISENYICYGNYLSRDFLLRKAKFTKNDGPFRQLLLN